MAENQANGKEANEKMIELRFIKSSEKKKIVEELNPSLGISEMPYLLIDWGREKIRAFSGSLSKEEIIEISRLAQVEGVGIYFLKREVDGLRPSFDALELLKSQITTNIIDISDDEFELWIRGHSLPLKKPKGLYAMRHNEDFLGCAKSNGETIFNYVPKERRIKKPLIPNQNEQNKIF